MLVEFLSTFCDRHFLYKQYTLFTYPASRFYLTRVFSSFSYKLSLSLNTHYTLQIFPYKLFPLSICPKQRSHSLKTLQLFSRHILHFPYAQNSSPLLIPPSTLLLALLHFPYTQAPSPTSYLFPANFSHSPP